MNKTSEYFTDYYNIAKVEGEKLDMLRAQLKDCKDTLSKKKLRAEIAIQEYKLEDELISAAKKSMRRAVNDAFDLTVDDIKDVLSCDDRFVANYILEHVDYIDAPKYSGHFFNNNLEYSCIDQIRLIWKKVFINRESFVNYLVANSSLKYFYYVLDQNKPTRMMHEEPLSREVAEVIVTQKTLFKRRCNLDSVIEDLKFASFMDRIINKYDQIFSNLTLYEEAEMREPDRWLKELKEIKELTPAAMRLKVRSKEITDYLAQNAHMELLIDCPGADPRMAQRSDLDGKEVNGKPDTSTTLYCVNYAVIEPIESKLNRLTRIAYLDL